MDWRHEPIYDPHIHTRVLNFFNAAQTPEEIVQRLGSVTGGANKIISLTLDEAKAILAYRESFTDKQFSKLDLIEDVKEIGPDQLYLIFTSFRERELETTTETKILTFLNAAGTPEEISGRVWADPAAANVKQEGHRSLYLDYFFKTTDATTQKSQQTGDSTSTNAPAEAISAELAKNILAARAKLTEKIFLTLEEVSKVLKLGAVDFHNILYSFAPMPVNSPSDLAALIKTDAWIAAMPAGFASLTGFELAEFDSTWDATTSSFSSVTFALKSPAPWSLSAGEEALLDEVIFYYDIQSPGTPEETMTASMETSYVAGDVPVTLACPLPSPDGVTWELKEPITLSSLGDVSALFDAETSALLPEGLLSAGGVELSALNVSVV